MKQMGQVLFFLSLILFSSFSSRGFADSSWKRVYLATYPRAGNHWSRYLIEEATHITTGSVYRDKEPNLHLEKPFPWGYVSDHGYEGHCRYPKPWEVVLIKTHYPAKPPSNFDLKPAVKVIRIIRHPVDSFYSHFLHQPNQPRDADGKITTAYVKKSILLWDKFIKYWDSKPNVETIYYENMLKNPYEALKKMLKICKYEVKDSDIRRAVNKHPPQGEMLKHIIHYKAEDLKLINDALGDLMKKHGYSIPKEALPI